jgi:hypothetical protein
MQESVLLRCIFDSLSLFGENTKAALLDNLRKEGVGFTSETFDIDKFAIVTEDLLGRSAEFIFVKILDEFCTRSNITSEEIGISGKAYDYMSNKDILRALFAVAK